MIAFSVLLYFLLLLWPFFFYFISRPSSNSGRFFTYAFSFFPVAVFAALRGNAGTDTENYRISYELLIPSESFGFGVDFLFTYLMAACKSVSDEFNFFAAVHSFSCLLLYSFGASRLDRVHPVFGLGVLPVLFLDSTFNGIRYGLAFAVLAAVIPIFYARRSRVSELLLLIPTFFHSSTALALLLSPSAFLLFLGAATYVALFAPAGIFEFFVSKGDSYADFQRPSALSGLFPILQFFAFQSVESFSRTNITARIGLSTVAWITFLAGVLLSYYSYAGLRFLLLAVFLQSCAVAFNVSTSNFQLCRGLVYIIGGLGVANYLRQIFIVGPEGGVGFHPYNFFFQSY